MQVIFSTLCVYSPSVYEQGNVESMKEKVEQQLPRCEPGLERGLLLAWSHYGTHDGGGMADARSVG